MTGYQVRMQTDGGPVTIGDANTREQAQRIADDWNKRYNTTDARFDSHAKVYPT